MGKKLSNQEFVERVKLQNTNNIQVISPYRSMRNRVEVECLDCGHVWTPKAVQLVHMNQGCPKCAGKVTHTQSEFLEKFLTNNSNKIDILGEYKGSKKSIKAKCILCNHQWLPTANNLLNGSGCPNCAGNQKKTHDEFEKQIKAINPNITILGIYEGDSKHIKVRCNKDDYEWQPRPGDLIQGKGCPLCGGKMQKSPNQFVQELRAVNPDLEVIGKYKNVG